MGDDDLGTLAAVPYFRGLPPAELDAIQHMMSTAVYPAGATILVEGEAATGLYIVRRGGVRVYKSGPDGKEQVLIVVGPGSTFNDVPVFDGGRTPANVQAIEPATLVWLLPRAEVAQLLSTNPHLAANVIRVLATRLRHLTMLVEDLSLRSIVGRVARLLLEEHSSTGAGTALTQQEMASRVGTVREVVSRGLRELEQAGAIERRRSRIVRIDAPRLRALLRQAQGPGNSS